MSNSFSLVIAAACLSAAPAFAQSPLDGTWKADITTATLPAKPDVITIKDGVYSCASCVPAYSIPADGRMHHVAGKDYWDAASVTVIDANTVRFVHSRKGKVIASATNSLSPDGNTLTNALQSSDNADGSTQTSTETEVRVAPAPAGAHAMSGGWRRDKVVAEGGNSTTMSISTSGQAITVSMPTGEHYTATLGGPAVPVIGDPAGEMVAVKRSGPDTLVFTAQHDGRPMWIGTATAASDGRSATWSVHDVRANTDQQITLRRQ